MPIDRIGPGNVGSLTPPSTDVGGVGGTQQKSFAAELERVRQTSAPTGVASSAALERLRAGDITRSQYVEMKIDAATAHLHGLSPSKLAAVKDALRERVATDPALVELVERASSGASPKSEDP